MPPRGSLASQTGLDLKTAREEVRSPLEFQRQGGTRELGRGQVAQVARTVLGGFGAVNRDGSVFQDEPGGGRKEDPTCELEPRSLHLGSVFLEMGAACLTPERPLGSVHFGSWEVLWAGCWLLSCPEMALGESRDRSLCLQTTCMRPSPSQPGRGAGAFSRGPSWSSQARDGTATGRASAAQALFLVPWHNAHPSLPGSSFLWHRVRSWCMLKE